MAAPPAPDVRWLEEFKALRPKAGLDGSLDMRGTPRIPDIGWIYANRQPDPFRRSMALSAVKINHAGPGCPTLASATADAEHVKNKGD